MPRRRWPHQCRADAAAQFARLFTASVERCTAGGAPSAVLLSGGPDSRHVLFALQELQRLPKRCVTVEPSTPSQRTRCRWPPAVANAVGVRHTVVSRRSNRVEAHLETQALTHSCADEHVQFLPLRGYLQHLQFHALDGLGGDVLSQSPQLDGALHRLFAEGRTNDVAARVLGDPAQIKPALAGVVGPAAVARFAREKAVASVAAEAGAHTARPNPIASFFFANRMRRETALAPYGVLDGYRVSTPFLDAALVDFLLALPFDAVADRRLHTETLLRQYPQHAPHPDRQPAPRDRRPARRPPRRDRSPQESVRVAVGHRPSPGSRGAYSRSHRQRREASSLVPASSASPAGSGATCARRGQREGAWRRARPDTICMGSDPIQIVTNRTADRSLSGCPGTVAIERQRDVDVGAQRARDRLPVLLAPQQRLPRIQVLGLVEVAVAT